MRRFRLVAAFVLFPLVQFGQERAQQDERVRATDPTVVTVHGRADSVQPNRISAKRSFGARVGGGFRTAASKTWNGIVGFSGWMLNAGDDVPSERERRERTRSDK